MNKSVFLSIVSLSLVLQYATAQALRIPQNTNIVCLAGRKIGVTEIEIHYSAPGVKGREGKIYGTNVVPFVQFPLPDHRLFGKFGIVQNDRP